MCKHAMKERTTDGWSGGERRVEERRRRGMRKRKSNTQHVERFTLECAFIRSIRILL